MFRIASNLLIITTFSLPLAFAGDDDCNSNGAPDVQEFDGVLYGLDAFGGITAEQAGTRLHAIDALSGATLASVDIGSLLGFPVLGGNGLARHPMTGELFAVLRINFPGGGGLESRVLATIDPASGAATLVGFLNFNVSDMTFDDAGTLYAVSGESGPNPATLFTVSTIDAEETLVLALGTNFGDGESIAFRPEDGLIYHLSGGVDGPAQEYAFELFESIDPSDLTRTDIPLSGDLFSPARSLAYDPATGNFLIASSVLVAGLGGFGDYYSLSPTGLATFIGSFDQSLNGLEVLPRPLDCDANLVPDECQDDADGDGVPNVCDDGIATNYCMTATNSVDAVGALISFEGSLNVSDNSLTLVAEPVPNSFGLFFFGDETQLEVLGQGFRCVTGNTFRLLPPVVAAGQRAERLFDMLPNTEGATILAGSTWFFQYWYRDPSFSPPPTNFNFSDGLEILFGM